MRNISLTKTYNISKKSAWEIITDLCSYPEFVPFIKDVDYTGSVKKGLVWYDTTTLLWIPQRISHRISVYQIYERLVFVVPLDAGGEVVEEYILKSSGRQTKLTMTVSVAIPNRIVERVLGGILLWRFRKMLSKTLENLEEYLKKN